MPEKAKLTVSDFLFVKAELETMGYRMTTKAEFIGDFSRLDLHAPRPKKGREATFKLSANFLNSIIHTSFDIVHGEWRSEDLVWELITKGDYKKYCSKPLRRTTNVLTQLLKRAEINKYRVVHRPRCSCCKAFMIIKEKYVWDEATKKMKPTGQIYWACFRRNMHPDGQPVFLGWDKIGPDGKIPVDLQQHIDMMRKRVATYKKRDRDLGIERTSMREIRHKWKIGRPENLET